MTDYNLRKIKQMVLFALIAIVSFGLGWWTKEMSDFAKGVKEDAIRLENINPFFLDDKCNEKLKEQTFYSPDNVTSGFNSITLQLLQTGQLFLIDSAANLINENETGCVYSWTTDTTAIGEWCLRNNQIYLKIQRDENFLKQTFLIEKNTNNGMIKRDFPTILVFSDKLDTLYINEIPCIRQR